MATNHYGGGEPGQPTLPPDSNRATIKWANLIAAATAMPTMSNPDCTQCNNGANPVAADTVGAFEGAGYYHRGLYRGQYACRMRALGNPLLRSMSTGNPADAGMPSWVYGTNKIGAGQTQVFPADSLFSLRSWREAMPTENSAHRLIG